MAPKSFGPNGKAALYLGPEVAPSMGCKDVHILLDLTALTSRGEVREILTRDFVPPQGSWVFPLTCVHMLKSPRTFPDVSIEDADNQDGDGPPDDDPTNPRNRSITKRRIHRFGPTEHCDGCLNGTYGHAPECRQRFNRILDASEPLPRGDGALTPTEHEDKEETSDDFSHFLTLLKRQMLNQLILWIWTLFRIVLQMNHQNPNLQNHTVQPVQQTRNLQQNPILMKLSLVKLSWFRGALPGGREKGY